MSLEDWNLDKNFCRCCHLEGLHESLYATRYWMDTGEIVYADMLKECFDIELLPVLLCNKDVSTICEVCIEKVKQALLFKRLVLRCESELQGLIVNHVNKDSTVTVTVKEEIPDTDVNHDKHALECNGHAIKNDWDLSSDDDVECEESKAIDAICMVSDCKLEDPDDFRSSIRKSSRKKHKSAFMGTQIMKSKISSSDGRKKKNKHPKKTLERLELAKGKKADDPTEDVIKVVKRAPKYPIQEGIDYKLTDDTYQCCRCEYQNKNFKQLRTHVTKVHIKTPKYNCAICSKNFLTLAPFTKHKFEEHNIDDRIRCNACDNIFNTKLQLKKHINCFHMLGSKHKCNQCDYESFSVESLYKHRFKHKTVKDYHCMFCKKSFLRKTNLQLHERIHTGDRRKVCKICGQAFVQKASLNYHMTKYHPGFAF